MENCVKYFIKNQSLPQLSKSIPSSKLSAYESFLRTKGISIYTSSTMHSYSFQKHSHSASGQVPTKFTATNSKNSKSYVLNLTSKYNSSQCSKEDLWIISLDPFFDSSFIARSVFYGISSSGNVELTPNSTYDHQLAESFFSNNYSCTDGTSHASLIVFAIRVANVMTEVLLESNLRDYFQTCPLAPFLIRSDKKLHENPLSECIMNHDDDMLKLSSDIITEFNLNQDQADVINSFSLSLLGKNGPITLVHGVFGSGKSFLICVIIIYLYRAVELNFIEGY